MACFTKLKEDLKLLEEILTPDHELFQINSATVDDLTCTFMPSKDDKVVIHANINVSIEYTKFILLPCHMLLDLVSTKNGCCNS